MGYIRHHGIMVTGGDWGDFPIQRAHAEARDRFGDLVSPIIDSTLNGYRSFFIAPDGSKEGWSDSDLGDDIRAAFIAWMDTQRYDDGSSGLKWAEVQYGDDEGVTRVTAHSDQKRRVAKATKA